MNDLYDFGSSSSAAWTESVKETTCTESVKEITRGDGSGCTLTVDSIPFHSSSEFTHESSF